MTDPRKVPRRDEVLAAVTWLQPTMAAVKVQHDRLGDTDWSTSQLQSDVIFYVHALDLFRTAVAHLRAALGNRAGPVDRALKLFDEEVPEIGDLRDIVAHFDAYARGDGYLLSGKAVGLQFNLGLTDKENGLPIEVRLGNTEERRSVVTGPATKAAQALFDIAFEVGVEGALGLPE